MSVERFPIVGRINGDNYALAWNVGELLRNSEPLSDFRPLVRPRVRA